MKPYDFFKSVHGLDESVEVNCRNIASRSYYSLYHSARQMFDDVPQYDGMGSHESLIKFMEHSYVPGDYDKKHVKTISYMLSSIKHLRVKADYLLDTNFSNGEARSVKSTVDKCLIKISVMTEAKTPAISNE